MLTFTAPPQVVEEDVTVLVSSAFPAKRACVAHLRSRIYISMSTAPVKRHCGATICCGVHMTSVIMSCAGMLVFVTIVSLSVLGAVLLYRRLRSGRGGVLKPQASDAAELLGDGVLTRRGASQRAQQRGRT